ncbi:MAG TPA: hypothetical protein VGK87_16530 [Anaerolineae bacterium]|jgi:hypothetical protein
MESQIAQAEYEAFIAKFNRPPREGLTVMVPNIIDRIIAAWLNLYHKAQLRTAQESAPQRAVPAR